MHGFTFDTEEVYNYVTKEAAGAEDTSGYFLKAFSKFPSCYAAEILKRLNFKSSAVCRRRVMLSPKKVIEYADDVAKMTGYSKIDTQHILLALSNCKNSAAAEELKVANITTEILASIIEGMSYHAVGKTESNHFAFDAKSVLGLSARLSARVIGQNDAVNAVSERLKRAAVGLQNPTRPIAAFLFTGSTGVGKTELSKAIADEVFGKGSLIKFDMSEYSDKASVTSLIGAPPAYVGFEEGGRLTGRIQEKPHSVVLFDEVEKAHRDVLNLLLQVLDEGTLTDMRGVKVNFTNCIIILTANALNCDIIKKKKAIGFDTAVTESDERELLKQAFPPEILGRLKVIRFRDLSREDYRKIASLEIDGLNKRLRGKKIHVSFDSGAEEEFSKDIGFGARGIRSRIEEMVESKLSDGILKNEIPYGSEVFIRYFEGEILLDIKTMEEAQL